MSAFDMVTAEAAYCALGASNTRVHCLPTTLGIDYRIINGRVYIGGNAVTDPVEIERRTNEFHQRAFYYYENWEPLYAQWREKMLALIRDAQALPQPELPEFEPLENVRAGRGVASNHYLLDIYQQDARGLLSHVAPPLRVPAARLRRIPDVLRVLQEGVSGDQRPDGGAHGRRHRGRDFPARRGAAASGALRRRARRGRALSATAVPAEDVIALAAEGAAAAAHEWLEELQISRDPWFNINVGDGFYHYHRSWNDDLSMPFAGHPRLHRPGQGGRVAGAAGRQAAGRAPAADRRLPRAARLRRGARRVRPDDRARASRVPLRRGPQVLLRALVHEPVLQQDPRVRRAARRARLLRQMPRTSFN